MENYVETQSFEVKSLISYKAESNELDFAWWLEQLEWSV